MTCFRARTVLLGGQDDGWRHMGKIFPKNSPKRVWIGSFKPKRQNFYIAISPELAIWRTSDLRSEYIQIMKCTSWVVRHYSKVNTTWLTAAILNIDMTSYFSGACSDLDEIRQPDAEWYADYGEMVEFETGSSYISAAIWGISIKFGLLIHFDLLKAVTSTNTKPEVVFSRRSRHLEKWIWRHISTLSAPIWTKFGNLIQNNIQITANWSRSKPEVEFQYGGRLYFETGSSYILAANGAILTKFGKLIDVDLLKAVTSTNTKPEVVFSGYGRHVEKWIWRHISTVGAPIWTKFGSLMQNNMQIGRTGRDRNQK